MKIQLIYPDVSSIHGLPYHPGLASIASVLIDQGHEVKVSYFDRLEKTGTILKHIGEFRPHLVGFTAVETQFRYVTHLASEIEKIHGCFVVCGGPYSTLAPEILLERDSPIDAAVIGEGEHAMAELAEKLHDNSDWMNTKNLAYMDSGHKHMIRNPLRPLIQDLDSLPYPNTELFPYQDIIDKENIAMFHFNRGCPYRCAFCSNTALGEVYGMSSNRLRYRSVDSVIDEIMKTLSKYKLRNDTLLYFGDDLFVSDKQWLADFCNSYKKTINRPFWCTGRSNYITDEICALLKEARCATLMMSVESGDDYIRNEVMMRNVSRETLFRSFELCHKHGINTLVSCIIGLPFETVAMIEDSIKTVAQLPSITSYGINIFYPYKGTYLRKVCEEKGFLPSSVEKEFVEREGSILNLPDLPKETIIYYHKNWVKLIMAHKGIKERFKYAIRRLWDAVRKTLLGRSIRLLVNNTKFGKVFKKRIMKYIWNRS